MTKKPFIRLASSSQTRAKLLKEHGYHFVQESVDFDEEGIRAKTPKEFVYRATEGKYRVNFERFGIEEYPLLVADTVVTSQGQILRKARCADDARNILMTQSGHTTSILTCMIYHAPKLKLVDISVTDYVFDDFDQEDLERYIQSGEWRGKAGACMVEGFCKKYIRQVRGYESTAMGLCVEKLDTFVMI